MTLNFSTKWSDKMGALAGKQTYFVEKITENLHNVAITDAIEYQKEYIKKTGQICG